MWTDFGKGRLSLVRGSMLEHVCRQVLQCRVPNAGCVVALDLWGGHDVVSAQAAEVHSIDYCDPW